MKILVKLLPLLLLSFSLQAQTDDHDHDHDHDHDDHSHHEHDHHANELGLAHLFVYFPGEKETAYGLHFHYLHYFADARYGIGLGTEYVFEHKHLNYGIVLSARPYKKFVLSISPGIATEATKDAESFFSFHMELSYEFEVGGMHIGPLVEYAIDEEETHISFGIHTGYGF